jgi:hypothetical protein
MFNARDYERMYSRMLGPLSQPVTLMVNNGTSYDKYENVSAHVSSWKENELVNGSSIELGDLKLIILAADIPAGIELMGMKDRVDIDGRIYAVTHWDAHSRTVGGDVIAVQATVRGGGTT